MTSPPSPTPISALTPGNGPTTSPSPQPPNRVTLALPTVGGTAVLEAVDRGTRVSVSATELGPRTSHGILIRTGTCTVGERQDFSDVVFEVMILQADDGGRAGGAAILNVPLSALADGKHKLTVGFDPGRSRGIDRGDIPSWEPDSPTG